MCCVHGNIWNLGIYSKKLIHNVLSVKFNRQNGQIPTVGDRQFVLENLAVLEHRKRATIQDEVLRRHWTSQWTGVDDSFDLFQNQREKSADKGVMGGPGQVTNVGVHIETRLDVLVAADFFKVQEPKLLKDKFNENIFE
jgi:hypothetical protein